MFTQTVTRLRATQIADHSGRLSAQRDWSTAESLTVSNVSIQVTMSDEDRSMETVAPSTRYVMYTAPGTLPDIVAHDRIVWNGLTLEVRGEPRLWHSPSSASGHHLEVTLQRTPINRVAATGVDAVLQSAVGATVTDWSP